MRVVSTLAKSIASNLDALKERIQAAALASGRRPDDVRLIAVSKTQPREAVSAAIAAGQRDFGENTVQDALTKIPHFSAPGVQWHFIGHLQSNKAKFIPGNFQWLHSLDGTALARRVARVAHERGVIVDCLIEVNITRDPARHGLPPERLPAMLDELLTDPPAGIRLRGLMAMGPHLGTESEIRSAFASVRKLRDDTRSRVGLADFTELSMGMSSDYAEAIKEGSTMVRIGTAIFGERTYPERRK
jgi:pyridoxal phosphate enzyme (YggS family)